MNNIELSTVYLPIIDEVYKEAAKTSVLEGDEATVKKGNNGEIRIAKLDMDGLGDFSRNDGYTKGSTSLSWETIRYDKERSQDLRIDRLDNDETVAEPFAKLAGEFIRTKVAPETDAARIAKIASTSGITSVTGTISTGAQAISALRSCANAMDELEVPRESRLLFIVPTLKSLIDDLDTTKSKEVMNRFSQIIEVPQTRMYTAITLNDGTSSYGYVRAPGEYVKTTDTAVDSSKTYYTKSGDVYTAVVSPSTANIATYYEFVGKGYPINFLCVEKSAAVCALEQYIKYFSPDEDQEGDSHVFKYRNNNLYGYCYENKLAGIYCCYNSAG